MKVEDPQVFASPRPAPASSGKDLPMPAFAVFGACVRSVSWANVRAGPRHPITTNHATARVCILLSSEYISVLRFLDSELVKGGRNSTSRIRSELVIAQIHNRKVILASRRRCG